jgi:hypothetical protein
MRKKNIEKNIPRHIAGDAYILELIRF